MESQSPRSIICMSRGAVHTINIEVLENLHLRMPSIKKLMQYIHQIKINLTTNKHRTTTPSPLIFVPTNKVNLSQDRQ
jgi:hypothetical protein